MSGAKSESRMKKPTMALPTIILRFSVTTRHTARTRAASRAPGESRRMTACMSGMSAGGNWSRGSSDAGDVCGAGTEGTWLISRAPSFTCPHARIEDGVQQIHDQVHEDGGDDYQQQDAVGQRVVLSLDGLEEVEADAGIGEDDLDEELAADDGAQGDGEARHARQDGVARGVGE